ncbi:hypothetical protein [Stenotrophomonas maltophilia]|uniref:hypothetical protein n=1 Tax=Stenotrophomonas maltophilia TaxID=40324 RepID=UPI002A9DB291|nr:hypothetical protein [Stenotrophomonas maltophilia]
MISDPSASFSSALQTKAYNEGTLVAWEAVGLILQLLAVSIGGKDEVISQLEKVISESGKIYQGDDLHRQMFLEPLQRLKSGAEVQRSVSIRAQQS